MDFKLVKYAVMRTADGGLSHADPVLVRRKTSRSSADRDRTLSFAYIFLKWVRSVPTRIPRSAAILRSSSHQHNAMANLGLFLGEVEKLSNEPQGGLAEVTGVAVALWVLTAPH